MTQKARIVLQDCKYALDRYSDELQGEALRVGWVSVIALLRAIGHVLDKVDRKSSEQMSDAIDVWWGNMNARRPEPAIFWDFIDEARNQTLKVYEVPFDRHITSDGPIMDRKSTKVSVDVATMRGGSVSASGSEFTSAIIEGPFAGRHEREVASDAYAWWKRELDEIDQLASRA